MELLDKFYKNPEVLVCSYGGVGTTMLMVHLRKHGLKTNHPKDGDGLKHSLTPPNIPSVKKAVYLFGDPVDAHASLKRRHFLERQKEKLHSKENQKEGDPMGFEQHMSNWLEAERLYPVMFIRFESLWEFEDQLNLFLNLDASTKLPAKKSRKSTDSDKAGSLRLYRNFRSKLKNVPDLWIKKAFLKPINMSKKNFIKGAFVGLMRAHGKWEKYEDLLAERNRLLHLNWNKALNYPIIIFNEGKIKEEHKIKMKKAVPNVQFVDIQEWWAKLGINHGYKKMCLFNCSYLQRWLHDEGYEYYARLDDDVFLFDTPNPINLFSYMKSNGIDYIYSRRKIDSHKLTQQTFPEFCKEYCEKNTCKHPSTDLKPHWHYYNNFHASRVGFWKDPAVVKFIDSCKDGISKHRWGDSPVQAAALRVGGGKVEQMDIKYSHKSHGYNSVSRAGEILHRHEWSMKDLGNKK